MSEHVVKNRSGKIQKKSQINWIAKVSVLGALAFILMMFEVPVPFAPGFYKLGVEDSIVLLGGFAMGGWAVVGIAGVKCILNLLFQGTTTAGVGELMAFVFACCYALPAVWYYKKHKNKKGAYIALLLGTVSLTISGAVLNYVVALPMYSYFYGMPIDAIVGMGTAINPLITNPFTFCLFAVAPFNLLKGTINSIIVALLYKRVSGILHR